MADKFKAGAPGRSRKSCGHPGCTVTLQRGTATYDLGVCTGHMAEAKPPVKPRQDVRSAVVASTVANGVESHRSMLITLRCEPWVMPGAVLPVGTVAGASS